ncbi:hypothetical protein KBX10_06070 [Corynebacterium sp. CCUG 59401]|nr:hypothetical protein [Corynebacterium pseudogenitalium]
MTTRTSRKVATVAFAAATALGLAACSPPNEQASEEKVATAQSQDPDSLTGAGQVQETDSTSAANVTDANTASATTTAADRENAESAPDGTPFYIGCNGAPVHQPVEINLNCKDNNDFALNIVWEEWSDEIAQGTTTRNNGGREGVEENVKITLTSPDVKDGQLVFTKVSIDGKDVMPQSDY